MPHPSATPWCHTLVPHPQLTQLTRSRLRGIRSPFAIFCEHKEPLVECYTHLRLRGSWCSRVASVSASGVLAAPLACRGVACEILAGPPLSQLCSADTDAWRGVRVCVCVRVCVLVCGVGPVALALLDESAPP